MSPHPVRHATRAVVAFLLAALVLVAVPGTTDAKLPAGGWALSTLDAVPELVAGEPAEVGFTILQHGQHPVEGDIGEVGIVVAPPTSKASVTDPSGGQRFFPARPGDGPGHFVATVTVPEAGSYEWSVRQGWFNEHALGLIEVATPTAADGWWSNPARQVLLALAVALGLVAVIDPRRIARRRAVDPDPVVAQ